MNYVIDLYISRLLKNSLGFVHAKHPSRTATALIIVVT